MKEREKSQSITTVTLPSKNDHKKMATKYNDLEMTTKYDHKNYNLKIITKN